MRFLEKARLFLKEITCKLLYKVSPNSRRLHGSLYRVSVLDNIMNRIIFTSMTRNDLYNNILCCVTEHKYRIVCYQGKKYSRLIGVKPFDTIGSKFFFSPRERMYNNIMMVATGLSSLCYKSNNCLITEAKRSMLISMKIAENFGYDPRFFEHIFSDLPVWEELWYFDKMNTFQDNIDVFDKNIALCYSKMYGIFRRYITSRRKKIHDTFYRCVLKHCISFLLDSVSFYCVRCFCAMKARMLSRDCSKTIKNIIQQGPGVEIPRGKWDLNSRFSLVVKPRDVPDTRFISIAGNVLEGKRTTKFRVIASHHILDVSKNVVICLLCICFFLAVTNNISEFDIFIVNSEYENVRLYLTRILVLLRKSDPGIKVADFLGALHILTKWEGHNIGCNLKINFTKFISFLRMKSRENGFSVEDYLDFLENSGGN